MDRQLSASLCAVTTDAADTFIMLRLIRPIADTDWVSVWCRNAWTDYAGLASCARLSLWPTTILGALNSGSAPAGRISQARCRWELMFRGHIISCHSERSEAATQSLQATRPGFQSRIKSDRSTSGKRPRCFASLNMTALFMH